MIKIEFYGDPTDEEKKKLIKGFVKEAKNSPGITEMYSMKIGDRVVSIRRNIWEDL